MSESKQNKGEQPVYIDTPAGIFTTSGNWFHTSTKDLESYAPGLFAEQSVRSVIKDAEVWIRTTDSLTILFFFAIMLSVSVQAAAVFSLIFMPLWYINKSAFTYPGISKILKLLDYEFVVVLIAVASLSVFGINEQYYNLTLGFLFFFLFKFGWYRKLIDRLYHKRNTGKLTLNDRLLRMMVVKYAQAAGENVGEVDKMEKDFLKIIHQKKEEFKQKKKK